MGGRQEKLCEGGKFRHVRNPPSQAYYTLNLYVHPSYDKKKACVNSISFIL